MEITNEIKAKVFAQYFGERITIGNKDTYESLVGIKGINSIYTGVNPMGVDKWYKISACQLILKPLSSITDEDAIEVAKICYHWQKEKHTSAHGKTLINGQSYLASHIDWIYTYQFLQSKGYDLPNYLLGGKTLHESRLAIYETPSTQNK